MRLATIRLDHRETAGIVTDAGILTIEGLPHSGWGCGRMPDHRTGGVCHGAPRESGGGFETMVEDGKSKK